MVVKFTFGSTSAMGTAPRIVIPAGLSIANVTFPFPAGDAWFFESGLATYEGYLWIYDGTSVNIGSPLVSASYPYGSDLSATVPFTWGDSDVLAIHATIPL